MSDTTVEKDEAKPAQGETAEAGGVLCKLCFEKGKGSIDPSHLFATEEEKLSHLHYHVLSGGSRAQDPSDLYLRCFGSGKPGKVGKPPEAQKLDSTIAFLNARNVKSEPQPFNMLLGAGVPYPSSAAAAAFPSPVRADGQPARPEKFLAALKSTTIELDQALKNGAVISCQHADCVERGKQFNLKAGLRMNHLENHLYCHFEQSPFHCKICDIGVARIHQHWNKKKHPRSELGIGVENEFIQDLRIQYEDQLIHLLRLCFDPERQTMQAEKVPKEEPEPQPERKRKSSVEPSQEAPAVPFKFPKFENAAQLLRPLFFPPISSGASSIFPLLPPIITTHSAAGPPTFFSFEAAGNFFSQAFGSLQQLPAQPIPSTFTPPIKEEPSSSPTLTELTPVPVNLKPHRARSGIEVAPPPDVEEPVRFLSHLRLTMKRLRWELKKGIQTFCHYPYCQRDGKPLHGRDLERERFEKHLYSHIDNDIFYCTRCQRKYSNIYHFSNQHLSTMDNALRNSLMKDLRGDFEQELISLLRICYPTENNPEWDQLEKSQLDLTPEEELEAKEDEPSTSSSQEPPPEEEENEEPPPEELKKSPRKGRKKRGRKRGSPKKTKQKEEVSKEPTGFLSLLEDTVEGIRRLKSMGLAYSCQHPSCAQGKGPDLSKKVSQNVVEMHMYVHLGKNIFYCTECAQGFRSSYHWGSAHSIKNWKVAVEEGLMQDRRYQHEKELMDLLRVCFPGACEASKPN